ncbi:NADH:ubiquinone reductase (Na(+)-transporting) subunit F [Pseudoruegeria sp. HB172150]|uniref:NADH:ubiquinone reductase (Na(+)-transporting) subunit F n=1 Tax=Pseudoruegeria sp. HB172150 TaxID=2721164 RepID=UPI0015573A8A|nr:NADH:ubiquinone reductase (Na(+)-transporting) subunit F [Pseudoruegeria sp. HB172150]
MGEIVIGSVVVIALILILTVGLLVARTNLMPGGNVVVTVNETKQIEAKRGDTLLTTLHNAGIGIPAGCGGSGTCGLCRVTATGEGAGEPQATEKGILSAAERRAHTRLACQVSLRGPADVTVPGSVLSAETFDCKVLSNTMVAPLIREFVLELPKGVPWDFIAGGFGQLTAPAYNLRFRDIDVPDRFKETWDISGWTDLQSNSPKPVTRAYSIASRPADAGKIIFNIRLAVPPAGHEGDIPPGVVSSYIFSLEPGDTIGVSGPFGEFHVQDTDAEMVFIGGGVGMAPLRSMIHDQIGKGTHRKMSYYYGARSVADLFYVEEFETIAAQHENFSWHPALSDPAPGDRWTGETGFIHEIVRNHFRGHPAPEDCEYYLCGPPVMISAVFNMLDKLGVERKNIYNDDFGI